MKSKSALAKCLDKPEISIMPIDQDREAFESLYKNYWDLLVDFAGRYLEDRQTCEEIVQDLFVQLYVRGLTVQIKHTLASYLFVALRNRIFNYFRNKAVYKKHITIAGKRRMVQQNNVEQSIYLKELEKSVFASLQDMPERYREVYLLKQEQLTIKQISMALSRPLDTVEKQLRKAKKLLIEHLHAQ
ncbi:MAG: sigma-70 family RNA polymerase sigma factor [Flavisolibacter sp.]